MGRYISARRSLLVGVAGAMLCASAPSLAQANSPPAASAQAKPVRTAELVHDLRAYCDRLGQAGKFSGAVLVAKGDKVVFERAYGYANRGFKAPNTLDTKFNLGSMGKMFTAVAILQLVEQGRLSLDDRLINVLPDYPDKEAARKITIYQLLTHTSGLGNMFNERYDAIPKDKLDTLQAHLALFSGKPLLFEPGTKWEYSNSGFIVLGLIIEKISGQSYYDYVREKVFKPAAMVSTDNYRPHDDVPNLAVGYTSDGGASGGPRPARDVINTDFLARGSSAGGGYSTVRDLQRFAQALMSYRLIGKRYVDLAISGKFPMGKSSEVYGFGMIENRINGVRFVGHGGGAPGVSANLDIYTDTGYTVAIMSNSDNGARLVNERIRILLTGQVIPKAIRMLAAAFQALAGRYAPASPPMANMPSLPPIVIVAERDGLSTMGRGQKHSFLPLSPTEFFDAENPNARIIFQRDEHGVVVGANFKGILGPPGVQISARRLP